MSISRITGVYLFMALVIPLQGQVGLAVEVRKAEVSSSCLDLFGDPEVMWSVRVFDEPWVTYSSDLTCFTQIPNVQFAQSYDCLPVVPDSVSICFKVFENDAFSSCSIKESCSESICQKLATPALGRIEEHRISLPEDLDSGGSLELAIGLLGNPVQPANDLICDAVDFGVLETGATLGDANTSTYNNYCATNKDELNPGTDGGWANDRGVWFTFQTGSRPGREIHIIGRNDPSALGDAIDLQFALYRPTGPDCAGEMEMLYDQYRYGDPDETLIIDCPQPDQRYYLMIDGPLDGRGNESGFFGLEIRDNGKAQALLTIDTTLCHGETLTVGSKTYHETGTYEEVFTAAGSCDSTIKVQLEVLEKLQIAALEIEPVSFLGLSDGKAGVEVTGGTGNYFYQWSNGATTNEITDLPAGVYCITVTDSNGCQEEDCTTINTALTPLVIEISGDQLHCAGDTDGQVSFSVAGGEPPYAYTWEGKQSGLTGTGNITEEKGTGTMSDLPADRYIITISDNSTLQMQVLAEVEEPEEIVTVLNASICQGEQLQVGNRIYQTTGLINERLTAFNGCDSVITGQLEVFPNPETQLHYELCAGESFTYAGNTYSESTNFVSSYTSVHGCDSIVAVDLVFMPPLSVSLAATEPASGYQQPDGTAGIVATGGGGAYSYIWSSGSTTSVSAGLMGGESYCATVTDGTGCTIEECLTVPYDADNIATIAVRNTNCFGSAEGQLTLRPAKGQEPFSYRWNHIQTALGGSGTFGHDEEATIAGLPSGQYEITVSDANVTTIKTATVSSPPPFEIDQLNRQDILCAGDCTGSIAVTVQGGTAPYSYTWSAGLGSGADQESLCAGSYQLTISDAAGCIIQREIQIEEPALPLSAQTRMIEAVSCQGLDDGIAEVTLSGGAGEYQVQWSNGQSGPRAEGLSSGNYYLTVTSTDGCIILDSLQVAEPPPLEAVFEAWAVNCRQGDNSGLIELSSAGGGVPPYTFALDDLPFQQLPLFPGLTPGNYTVRVQDRNGCTKSYDLAVDAPPAIEIQIEGETTINLGYPVELSASGNITPLQFIWTEEGGETCRNCSDFSFLPLRSSNLRVEGIDPVSGCRAVIDTFIRVDKRRDVYIPNAFSPNGDRINDVFAIFGGPDVQKINSFRVFDRHGALLHERYHFSPNDLTAGWSGRIRNQIAPAGVYVHWAEIQFIDGEILLFKGDVTLIK